MTLLRGKTPTTTFAKNCVALITGAGSGIGRELARRLSEEGVRIAAIDRNVEALTELSSLLKDRPLAIAVADVADLNSMRQAATLLEAQLGPIDLLIASAGIGRKTSIEEFSAEEINAHIQVNLIGVVNSVAVVLDGMRLRRRGHLVALSSVASYRGLPFMGGYCASKAGVNALFDSFRMELAPLGIATTIVCPAWIRTPMTAPLRLPESELMSVEKAAEVILDAIRKKKIFVAFPAKTVWQARMLRYLPRSWSDWMIQRDLPRIRRLIS